MVRSRIRILAALLLLPFLVVLGRLYQLQVLDAEHYKALSLDRRRKVVRLPARRGSF